MELKPDVSIKYLTDNYKIFNDYPSCIEDYVYALMQEIKNSRKTKKNWNIDDYVFTIDMFNSLFSDSDISILLDDGYVIEIESQYKLTSKSISLFFNI